jgi:hypothetical protein
LAFLADWTRADEFYAVLFHSWPVIGFYEVLIGVDLTEVGLVVDLFEDGVFGVLGNNGS